jgi:exodeoxyribonuclease-3
MKLVSWNVNGIRACIKKGFADIFDTFAADVFCLQEIKATPEQADFAPVGYNAYWNPAEKKGYSGTAVFSKIAPQSVRYGIGTPELDTEGRVITLEFANFFLVNVYTPNARADLSRLGYRQVWEDAFRNYLEDLAANKPIAVCGDLNVAHKEIDLAHPAANRGQAGFTDEERAKFSELLDAGFCDSFRALHPDLPDAYTWWSYRAGARGRNVGWRIDYFVVSQSLMPRVESAHIWPEVLGSDHCPVSIDVHF